MPLEAPRRAFSLAALPREAIAALVIFALAWEALSRLSPALGIPPFAFPSLATIARSLATISPSDVAVTLARVIAALMASFLFGVGVAVLMYLWPSFERYGRPLVRLLMAIPVISWILFAVLWFKGVELRIVFVLVATCAPVFVVDTLDGMRGVPLELRQMLRSFRPTSWQFFRKLMLPAVLPTIFTSWKITLSLAVRVVTIAELVGAVTGIGHQLNVAQELFSVADIFAWTVVLVALLFLLEGLVARVETRMLRWRV
jgi:NitT/TauT family transport system permease protein